MFIGHHAVAFATKPAAPRLSLGTLLMAAAWLDLVWPVLLLLDIEHVRIVPGITRFNAFDLYDYPWSHSLVMAVVWSALFAAGARVRRYDARAAALVGLAVFSHWVLDFVTHRPDMPLWPGSATRVGLGLWNSVPGTLAVEGTLYVAALVTYTRATIARDGVGTWALRALAFALVLLYIASIVAPPPQNQRAIGFGGLFAWVFVAWAYWVDRHRRMRDFR